MKKIKILSILTLVVAVLSFIGCELIDDLGYRIVDATKSISPLIYEANMIIEVDSSVKSVTVNNIPSGKTLYLVKRNTGSEIIKLNDTRQVISSSRNAIGLDEMIKQTPMEFNDLEQPQFKYFHPKVSINVPTISNRQALMNVIPGKPSTKNENYTVGAQKDIFVDINKDMNNYGKKSAHLRAQNEICNVWVVDDYWTSGIAYDNRVNQTIVNNYASNFKLMYPYIREVFGKELDYFIYSYYNGVDSEGKRIIDNEFYDMEEFSTTGNKVNIVIYDIGMCDNGVLGYFSSKDYNDLRNAPSSNVGKYFYIDSKYSVENFNDVISTLAHEFQHMINYRMKNLELDEIPAVWYNEMLSMLCEDMMQSKLGLADKYSPKARLKNFNAGYYLSGITEYIGEGANQPYSYATAYTFGAWLARQYGGASLIKKISQNNYVNEESIVEAIYTLDTKYSPEELFDNLLMQYFLALTGNTKYTHNQDGATTLTSKTYPQYSYPMGAINLKSLDYALNTDKERTYRENNEKARYSEYKDWCGPFLFNNDYGCDLRGENGITIHGIKKYTSTGTDTITFSSKGAETLKMYLIIQ